MTNKKLLFALGRPLSPLYGMLMRLREAFYRQGVFTSARLGVPVISVGNLTLGGTGKTPMVEYLVRLLRNNGYQPAIISRGYGGATKEPFNIVADSERLYLDAAYVGDEPRLLAEKLPGVPVLTGVVRKLPAAKAVELGADVLILDDGFQHMAVARDIDLVLFSGDVLAGNSRVFPGGDLREPVKALHRCNHFVLTGINEKNEARCGRFSDLLKSRFPDKDVFWTRYVFRSLVFRKETGTVAVFEQSMAGKKCFAFCAIARPESFYQTLNDMGIDTVGFLSLADHHNYRKNEIDKIVRQAGEAGADFLLTTEKDLVKLNRFSSPLPLLAVRMEVEDAPELNQYILTVLRRETDELVKS